VAELSCAYSHGQGSAVRDLIVNIATQQRGGRGAARLEWVRQETRATACVPTLAAKQAAAVSQDGLMETCSEVPAGLERLDAPGPLWQAPQAHHATVSPPLGSIRPPEELWARRAQGAWSTFPEHPAAKSLTALRTYASHETTHAGKSTVAPGW